MGGRILGTAVWGFLLFLFLALDLVLFGLLPLNSAGVTLLPLLGLALGAVLGRMVAQRSAAGSPGAAPAAPAAVPPVATTVAPPAPAPSVPRGAPAFVPTHTIPAEGLPAWSVPDPTAAVAGNLDPWLPVQVIAWQGDWAEILCANGWQAWVNGRLLLPA